MLKKFVLLSLLLSVFEIPLSSQESNILKVFWTTNYVRSSGELITGSPFNRLSVAYRFGGGKLKSEIELLPMSISRKTSEQFDTNGNLVQRSELSQFSLQLRYMLSLQVIRRGNFSAYIGFSERALYNSNRIVPEKPTNTSRPFNDKHAGFTSSFVPSIYYAVNERIGIEFNFEMPLFNLSWDESYSQGSLVPYHSYFSTYSFNDLYHTLFFRLGLGYKL